MKPSLLEASRPLLSHVVSTHSLCGPANGQPGGALHSGPRPANKIQDAVDAATIRALVMVTNGTYAPAAGAGVCTLTNRVA